MDYLGVVLTKDEADDLIGQWIDLLNSQPVSDDEGIEL